MLAVGAPVGVTVGAAVGAPVGALVGDIEGAIVGTPVGACGAMKHVRGVPVPRLMAVTHASCATGTFGGAPYGARNV